MTLEQYRAEALLGIQENGSQGSFGLSLSEMVFVFWSYMYHQIIWYRSRSGAHFTVIIQL
jgi:hypothetical protein